MTISNTETEITEINLYNTDDKSNDSEYIDIRLLRDSYAMNAFRDFPFHYHESCSYSISDKTEMMFSTLIESYAYTRLEILELFTEEEFVFLVFMFSSFINSKFLGINWFISVIENACKYDQLDVILSLDKELLIEKISKLSYFQALCLRLLAISYLIEPNDKPKRSFNQNNQEDLQKFNQIFGFSEHLKKYIKNYYEFKFEF